MAAVVRTLAKLLTAIGSFALARRMEGISNRYLATGIAIGFSYRTLESAYVGRFRDNPRRYLAFFVFWNAAFWPFVPEEESDDLSLAAGVCLGSVLYRLTAENGA